MSHPQGGFNSQQAAAQASPGKIQYSSKLIATLNKFAQALTTEVKNPMQAQYGDAYDYVIKGDAHRLKEETEDAIRAYETALTLHPDFVDAYVGLGRSFRRKGDLKRAIFTLSKALTLNTFDKEVHVELAKTYNEAGMPKKSIQHFRHAVKLDPQYIEARFNLALTLELQGDLHEAADIYQAIIHQDADFLPAYNNLGSIQMRQGDYKASEVMFRRLIEMAPDFSRGYLGLAISLDRTNRGREALQYYEKLLVMKAHTRNKEFIENRVVNLRQNLNRNTVSTTSRPCLVRVK